MAKTPTPEQASQPEAEQIWRTLNDMQASGFGSLSWLGTRWVETMSDMGSEWLSFVADRVREDVKMQHELLHAKDIKEVQTIQAKFLQKALTDYTDETGKMVQLCTDAMADISAKAEDAKH